MDSSKLGLETLEVDGKYLIIRKKNGFIQVNATEMGKPFGEKKKPSFWIENQAAKDYINALAKLLKIKSKSEAGIPASADLVDVTKGGKANEQGTWFHEDIALEYARWLSPEFGVLVNWKFKEYMQIVSVQTKSENENYFGDKAELYKAKHKHETRLKSIFNIFYNSDLGREAIAEQKELKKVKKGIAQMDKKKFGYTYNMFPLVENE